MQVFSAVQERFGNDSAELQLVAVRLGISSAACGRLEAGLKLIYDAAPVLQHNLSRMVEQAQAAAAQGGLDEQAAVSEWARWWAGREDPRSEPGGHGQQRQAAPRAVGVRSPQGRSRGCCLASGCEVCCSAAGFVLSYRQCFIWV